MTNVVKIEATSSGFSTVGKSVDQVNDEVLKLLESVGKVGKIDLSTKLSKSNKVTGQSYKVLASVIDANGNVLNIHSRKLKGQKDQYELYATSVKRTTDVLKENTAAQREADKQNAKTAQSAEAGAKKWREALDSIAKRKASQADVTDLNKQLGGFKGMPTQAGMLGVDRANKNLLDLLSKSNISKPRLDEIFGATRRNDRGILDNLSAGEQKVSIALRRLSAAFDQLSDAGKRSQNILIGFSGMLRLLEVQQLHSVISSLQSYFDQASQKSIELAGKIAEIQTISQSAKISTDEWADSLVRLSNAYGFDVIDVAKAGYEAISNQIAKGAEVTPFLAQAFEFARATSSTAAESVDLLSSALNGYGLGAEHTQRVSAILFKTIELGRVRASELAQTLGNSTPIANALGISLEELSAGVATLTIQGVKPHTALTLMNNVMLKLLKPTKDMQELLEEWGVASGEAAIKAFGFAGVLQRLDKEFQAGGLGRIAGLAGDMRAIRAQAGLLAGGSFDKFIDSLEQMKKGQLEYKNAVDITAESMQTKLAVEFQKLNNLFVRDVGFRKNKAFLEAIEQIGGLDKATEGFANAMVSMTKILLDVAVPLVNINTGLESLGGGVSRLAPAILTGGTAFLLFDKATSLVSAGLPILNRNLFNTYSSTHGLATGMAIAAEKTGLFTRNATTGALGASVLGAGIVNVAAYGIPLLVAAYSYLTAAQEEAERKMLSAGSNFLNSVSGANVEASKKLQESIQELNNSMTEGLTENLKKLNLYYSVFQSRLNVFGKEALKSFSKFAVEDFENNLIGKNTLTKLSLISGEYDKVARSVTDLFEAKNYDGAEKAVERILDLTKQFKDEQRKVFEEVKKVTDKLKETSDDKAFEYKYFTKSERKQYKAYGQRSEEVKAEAVAAFSKGELEKADKLVERAISIREKSMSISESIVSSQGFGKPKGLPQFQELLDLRSKIQTKLGETAAMSGKGDFMVKQSREFNDNVLESIKNVSALETQIQKASSAYEALIAQQNKATSKLKSEKDASRENISAFAAKLEDVTSRTGGFAKQSYSRDLLVHSYAQEKINLYGLIGAYEKLAVVKEDLQKSLLKGANAPEGEIAQKFEAARKQLEVVIQLQNRIRNLAKSANEQRFFDLEVLTDQTTGSGIHKKTTAEILEEARLSALNGVKSTASVNEQQKVVNTLSAEGTKALADLKTANNELGELFKKNLPETFKAATEAIKASEDPVRQIQDRLRDTLKELKDQVEKLIPKLKDAKPLGGNVGGAPVGNALGGMLLGAGFAGGGYIDGPLGRDNLFIRAHAGEFVVNAEAAQKFYPQLTAMNSMYSATPNYNNGGPITSVGDIHINANLTGQTDIDVVALGKQLRREIKRGTVRLT